MVLNCLRPLVTSVSLRRSGFDPGPVIVRFVIVKVALGHVFFRVLLYFLVNIIPPMLLTHANFNYQKNRWVKKFSFVYHGTLERKLFYIFCLFYLLLLFSFFIFIYLF